MKHSTEEWRLAAIQSQLRSDRRRLFVERQKQRRIYLRVFIPITVLLIYEVTRWML